VDAYSYEDIRCLLADEEVLLGERSFEEQDYEQALVYFEEARHLRSPGESNSIVAWISKCNSKLGIDVKVPSYNTSTIDTSTAVVVSEEGCSRQSG